MVLVTFQTSCDKSPDSSVLPATNPARTTAANVSRKSSMHIDDQNYAFKPLTVSVTVSGRDLLLEINSTGAADDAVAHLIHFDIRLPGVNDAAKLGGEQWAFFSNDTERVDTLNQIQLKDQNALLEPVDVKMNFELNDKEVQINISGTFRWYDPPDAETARKDVAVKGKLFGKLKS